MPSHGGEAVGLVGLAFTTVAFTAVVSTAVVSTAVVSTAEQPTAAGWQSASALLRWEEQLPLELTELIAAATIPINHATKFVAAPRRIGWRTTMNVRAAETAALALI